MTNNNQSEIIIEGDGNCLFRSFSVFLYGTEYYHQRVRLKIAFYGRNNFDIIREFTTYEYGEEPFVDGNAYYNFISIDKQYGGTLEILLFHIIYKVRVNIYASDSLMLEFNSHSNNIHMLSLTYSGTLDRGHYNIKSMNNLNYSSYRQQNYNRDYYEKNKSNDDFLSKKRKNDLVSNMSSTRHSNKLICNKTSNMSAERHAKKLHSDTPQNMLPTRRDHKLSSDRCESMSVKRHEKKMASDTTSNMTSDRHRRKLLSDTTEHMSVERHKRKLVTDKIEHMSSERHTRKKLSNTTEHMSLDRHDRKLVSDLTQNMSQERHAHKLFSDNTNNMTIERHDRKLRSDTVANMSTERHDKKLTSDLIQNMSQARREKKLSSDVSKNMPDSRRSNHKNRNRVHNMLEIRRKAKKRSDGKKHMPKTRYIKRKLTQSSRKLMKDARCDFGEMDYVCPYCGARFWQMERNKTNCCQKGKIKVVPLTEYDPILKDLLLNDSKFRQNILSYNSSFSFATFGDKSNRVRATGGGIPIVKIQGRCYYLTPTSLEPEIKPYCGQIYIFDDEEATATRMAENQSLVKSHIVKITKVLSKNPYTRQYKSLHELSKPRNVKNYRLLFCKEPNTQLSKTYNLPVTAEVAALIVSKDGSVPEKIDVCVYPKCPKGVESRTFISDLSFHLDPMLFPLLFPSGDLGFSEKYTLTNGKKMSAMQYYCSRLAWRPDSGFNPIFFAGKLTQSYVIHGYLAMEHNRLNFIRNNQQKLRFHNYKGVMDHFSKGNIDINADRKRLGHAFILPASYVGSPRYMNEVYHNNLAVVRKKGMNVDLFITITCNPKWPEIVRELKKFPPGTTTNDIPMHVCRIFRMYLLCAYEDIMSGNVFGTVIASTYVIEFQKRGLPHAHMIFILHPDNKLNSPEQIDKVISAEIPEDDDILRSVIMRHNLHGPHSKCPPCWDPTTEKCSKHYPKPFSDTTCFADNGFPIYRRRDNSSKEYIYNKFTDNKPERVDNSMVVPYNPFLSQKYDAHINVETCASVMSLKYLFKYLTKGHDRINAKLESKTDSSTANSRSKHFNDTTYDEIGHYLDCRYVSAMEGAWRILRFPLTHSDHKVTKLHVHMPDYQNIFFPDKDNLTLEEIGLETTLTAWFKLNETDNEAKSIYYESIPEYYTFNKKRGWRRRKSPDGKTIGRLISVSPNNQELFHLKLILLRVKGATSFLDLRTYDGTIYDNFRDTAVAMGLIYNSKELFVVFQDACDHMMPRYLRDFFSIYLIAEKPTLAKEIWEKFKKFFTEDFSDQAEDRALTAIQDVLKYENLTCADFYLPTPKLVVESEPTLDVEYYKSKYKKNYTMLNVEQKHAFHLMTDPASSSKLFSVDSPAGCGKTFLFETLIYYFWSLNKSVISMAWTGIASILLPGGMTSHKVFKLPISMKDTKKLYITMESDISRIKNCDVIMYDESSMIPRKALKLIESSLRDICETEIPFGGKVIILGGDFRQTLPVIKYGTKSIIIKETIKSLEFWKLFHKIFLQTNMRSIDNTFSKMLLEIGNGAIDNFDISKYKTTDVCTQIFGKQLDASSNFSDRVILCPHNEETNSINEIILSKLPGSYKIYYSVDTAKPIGLDMTEYDTTMKWQPDVLNKMNLPGLPRHKLKLKKNAIVMLVRNLSSKNNLCNGTRLKILELHEHSLKTEIITGEQSGQIAYIPKIQLETGEHSHLPFNLLRRQFPVILAFAQTINKSQGQSYNSVGLFLKKPLFSHGQLYVALSRCRDPCKLFIENKLNSTNYIKNVVWTEIFKM